MESQPRLCFCLNPQEERRHAISSNNPRLKPWVGPSESRPRGLREQLIKPDDIQPGRLVIARNTTLVSVSATGDRLRGRGRSPIVVCIIRERPDEVADRTPISVEILEVDKCVLTPDVSGDMEPRALE